MVRASFPLFLATACVSRPSPPATPPPTVPEPGCDLQKSPAWPDPVELDGQPGAEFLVEDPDSCGTGSCTVRVLQACASGGHRVLGTIPAWDPIEVLPSRHKGFADLRTTERISDTFEVHLHIWNGTTYTQPFAHRDVAGPDGQDRVMVDDVTPDGHTGPCQVARVVVWDDTGGVASSTIVDGWLDAVVSRSGDVAGLVGTDPASSQPCGESIGLFIHDSVYPLDHPAPATVRWDGPVVVVEGPGADGPHTVRYRAHNGSWTVEAPAP